MPGATMKFKNGINLLKNMGWRYTSFKIKHEFLKRSGLLKKKFPQSSSFKKYISLQTWKQNNTAFFFHAKEEFILPKKSN